MDKDYESPSDKLLTSIEYLNHIDGLLLHLKRAIKLSAGRLSDNSMKNQIEGYGEVVAELHRADIAYYLEQLKWLGDYGCSKQITVIDSQLAELKTNIGNPANYTDSFTKCDLISEQTECMKQYVTIIQEMLTEPII